MRFFWLQMIGARSTKLCIFIGVRDARINFRGYAKEYWQRCNSTGLLMWALYCARQAQRDARKLASRALKTYAQQLLTALQPWSMANAAAFWKADGPLERCLIKKNYYSALACLSGLRGSKRYQDIAALDPLRVDIYSYAGSIGAAVNVNLGSSPFNEIILLASIC
jgi:hypothetical protein